MARRKKSRSKRRTMSKPSITGLASGLLVGRYLNEGNTPQNSVLGAISTGHYQVAADRFLAYGPALVMDPEGRKVLMSAIGIAVAGKVIKRAVPNVKLGYGRYYATI